VPCSKTVLIFRDQGMETAFCLADWPSLFHSRPGRTLGHLLGQQSKEYDCRIACRAEELSVRSSKQAHSGGHTVREAKQIMHCQTWTEQSTRLQDKYAMYDMPGAVRTETQPLDTHTTSLHTAGTLQASLGCELNAAD